MAVPWTGFPLKAFVDWAKPLGSAKYVQFETFMDPKMAPGQKSFFYPWPYVEGVTMAEATNDLAFMVTGRLRQAAAQRDGRAAAARAAVEIRLQVGQIDRQDLLRRRAPEDLLGRRSGPDEYGFWANVNPEVPHPRWSQASEEILGTGERKPTLLFNGYAEQVARPLQGHEGRDAVHVRAAPPPAVRSASAGRC